MSEIYRTGIQSINPEQDYDYIHTIEATQESGSMPIRFYSTTSTVYTGGSFFYRMGTSGQWTSVTRQNPRNLQYTESVFQIQYNKQVISGSIVTQSLGLGANNNPTLKKAYLSQRQPDQGQVGNYYFYYLYQGCTNAEYVEFPITSEITSQGESLFGALLWHCNKLTHVYAPDFTSLTSVGGYMYTYFTSAMQNLEHLELPDIPGIKNAPTNLMRLNAYVTPNLKSVKMPDISGLSGFGTQFMHDFLNNSPQLEKIILPSSPVNYHRINTKYPSTQGKNIVFITDDVEAWKPLLEEGRFLQNNGVKRLAKRYVVMGTDETGITTQFTNGLLNTKLSEAPEQGLRQDKSGLWVGGREYFGMGLKNTEDYVNNEEIKEFIKKDEKSAALSDYLTSQSTSSLAYESAEDYYVKDEVHTKINELPKDKFLGSAKLNDDIYLEFEVLNPNLVPNPEYVNPEDPGYVEEEHQEIPEFIQVNDTVTVSLDDKIPNVSRNGVQGTGLSDDPLRVSTREDAGLGSITEEDISDYDKTEVSDKLFASKKGHVIQFNRLGGQRMGITVQSRPDKVTRHINHSGEYVYKADVLGARDNRFYNVQGDIVFVVGKDDFRDLVQDFQSLTGENPTLSISDDYGRTYDITLNQVVTSKVTDMSQLFKENQTFNQKISSWDVSNVTDTSEMFYRTDIFNQDISTWDVSSVTNMEGMFHRQNLFSIDLSSWQVTQIEQEPQDFNTRTPNWHKDGTVPLWGDLSKVCNGLTYNINHYCYGQTPIQSEIVNGNEVVSIQSNAKGNRFYQFRDEWYYAPSNSSRLVDVIWECRNNSDENGVFELTDSNNVSKELDLTKIITTRVTDMSYIFENFDNFNQDISGWDTSSVTTMSHMFQGQSQFNQDISHWDTSKVQSMNSIFYGQTEFNQDISGWNTGNVRDMANAFSSQSSFNQDISDWNTSRVTDMNSMFFGQTEFNQDIGSWDTSKVLRMGYMFQDQISFNQDIGSWNIENVYRTSSMFENQASFNQDIGSWDTSNVTNIDNMFKDQVAFNQDLSGWCVENINQQLIGEFAQNTPNWDKEDRMPEWGEPCKTCSDGSKHHEDYEC